MFIQVKDAWVRRESVTAVAPTETGCQVYAGGTVFTSLDSAETILAQLDTTGA